MKYFILPLGCQMNLSDSERICSVLDSMGYTRTEDEKQANILGVIACSVRQKAIDKVYSRIAKWSKWKENRNILTFASGCILPADKAKLLKRFDILFSIQELPQLPDMIRQYGVPTEASARHEIDPTSFWQIHPAYQSDFEAYIPIQNGCNKFCSFCAVPYTRGREVSRRSQDILTEVSELVEAGYKSITLLGQNVNSYGLDKKNSELRFPQLMQKIGEFGAKSGKEFRVYFTSPHPRDMTEDLLHVIADYPVLAKQIHLPLQSGDDTVLKNMRRGYTRKHFMAIVENIRRILPSASLFTDIIVGFSGETDEQFNQTRTALEEMACNMAYIAMYSPRPGAESAKWEDTIPLTVKKQRLHILSNDLQRISRAYNDNCIGKTVRLLVDRADRKKGWLSGKSEGSLTVRFPCPEENANSYIGSFVDTRITSAANLSMEGELIAP